MSVLRLGRNIWTAVAATALLASVIDAGMQSVRWEKSRRAVAFDAAMAAAARVD